MNQHQTPPATQQQATADKPVAEAAKPAAAPATKRSKRGAAGTTRKTASKRAVSKSAKSPAKPAAKKRAAKKAAAKKTAVKKPAAKKPAAKKAIAKKPAAKKLSAKKAPVRPSTNTSKPTKAKKSKLVRDSFTMPAAEYAQIAAMKKACLGAGFEIKKSEILRIGVSLLSRMDPKKIRAAQAALEPLKAGRPKKHK